MKPLFSMLCLVGLVLSGWGRMTAQNQPPIDPPPLPNLTFDAPTDHQAFRAGTPITLKVTAVDPVGGITRVEFFADAQKIGVSEIFTLVPIPPGEPVHHEFVWQNAPRGAHVLLARSMSADGVALNSRPLIITVDGDPARPGLRILTPSDLAQFKGGEDVPIAVEAWDPTGLITSVAFFANGESIGESVFDPCPRCDQPPCPLGPCVQPPPGTVLNYHFLWKAPAAGKYALEVRGTTANGERVGSATVRLAVTEPEPTKSLLTFDSPAEGSTFSPPAEVRLQVTAIDPQSEIRRVEFFAGDHRLGVSEILTRDAVIPGRPRVHTFTWVQPPVGEYTLWAKATDSTSHRVVSEPRHIRVLVETVVPQVTVLAVAPYAVEGDRENSGLLAFRRTGDISQPLTVEFELSGQAERGADYTLIQDPCWPCDALDVEIPGNRITFPPGSASVMIGVLATFDAAQVKAEPVVEKITLQVLTPAVIAIPGAKPPYEAGQPSVAEVLVVDRANPAVATVILTSPPTGTELAAGAPIPLEALAIDPAGSIRRLEFFAGEKSIGVSEITTEEVDIPGRLRVHRIRWEQPPIGEFKLRALAKPAHSDPVWSEAVAIRVGPGGSNLPTLTILTAKSPAFESGDLKSRWGSFQVERHGGDPMQLLQAFFVLHGTATAGTDYQLTDMATGLPPPDASGNSLQSLMFLPGQNTVEVALVALPDSVTEGVETVVATLIEPPFAAGDSSPLPAQYVVGEPREATVEIRDQNSSSSSLVITSPLQGAHFTMQDTITIDTVGQDPDALVSTVEFFANGTKIGESCFLCVVDGIFQPGTPLHNRLDWKPTAPGNYRLTAVGQFGSDRKITAEPVSVQVEGNSPVPRLTITQPAAGDVVRSDRKTLVVAEGVGRVGGITDVELLLDGKPVAESHLDFFRPPGADETVRHEFEVQIPAGTHSLVVRDFSDPQVISPPVKVIAQPAGSGITLTWTKPTDGSIFPSGTPIELEVQAVDPQGLVFHVDFFADGQPIGGSDFDCPQCRLAPGATITHRFAWSGAPVGSHTLYAAVIDAAGNETPSASIQVVVKGGSVARIEAMRTLPRTFVPGTKFTVSIQTKPGEGVQNYVIEDHPPFLFHGGAFPPPDQPLWTVTATSDDGVFDIATGAVKFGPFFDAQPRTLTYEITPNEVAAERAEFNGVAVADGISVPIGGDQVLEGHSRHPADRDPADDSINAVELTAYGAAWKNGQEWASAPNPIPMDYVTRAASLWSGGEHYRFDPSAGLAPLCWVSNPLLPPLPPMPGDPATGEDAAQSKFHGVALRWFENQADQTGRVAVRVIPAPGTRAFAVEEKITGAPLAVSDGGVFDSTTQTIRWGPFLDGQPRTLTYRFEAGISPETEHGLVSFDGVSGPVRSARSAADPATPHVVSVDDTRDGAMQIVIEDSELGTGAPYELEMSSDLQRWTRTGKFVNEHTAGFARDEAPAAHGARFYRAVRAN